MTIETEPDYESLPNSSLTINMLAGATAGITEHVVIYPLDVLKTRLQNFNRPKLSQSLLQSMRKVVSAEGAKSMWKGLSSVVVGAGPAHALYFGAYEQSKNALTSIDTFSHNHLSHAGAGIIAAVFHDGFITPFDVIKQRMQLGNFSSIRQCAQTIYVKEGVRAFYISYPVTLAISLPFQVVHFTSYEYFKELLNPTNRYDPLSHCLSGGLAGGFAAMVTNPLDVAKTMLQTRGISEDPIIRNCGNLSDAVKIVWTRERLGGFMRGCGARVLAYVPSTAVSWTAYEFLKVFLSGS